MITNKNFSIAMQENLAFEISGQNLLLAKGNVLFGNKDEAGSSFRSVNEETISTLLGKGKRFAFSTQRGDLNIMVTVDLYDDLDDGVVMQWTFKNTGNECDSLEFHLCTCA